MVVQYMLGTEMPGLLVTSASCSSSLTHEQEYTA